MSEPLKISIITASFRSESTIKDTLESVNIQTYPRIDHIVIDGASKDGTLELVKAHGKRVTHVTSEPDKGIFDAYNKGLAVADGEIVGILNSDDFYASPNVIAHVMQAFEDPVVEAVYADLVYVDKDDTNKIVRHWKSRPYRAGDFTRGFSPAHPTLFLRKSVYDRTGGFNPGFRFSGDYEYMLRAFHTHGVKSVYLPEIVVRMRTGGATGGALPFIKKQNLEILRALDSQGVSIFKPTFFARKLVDRLMQRLRALFVRLPESMS
ncbi:MAG: glycosyltransferase [Rhodocyclales bacterium]|nr:glycosyltransferase [Rhodocyclales bacterium]